MGQMRVSEAERIAVRDYVKEIDFKTDFAMLEGETGCKLLAYRFAARLKEPKATSAPLMLSATPCGTRVGSDKGHVLPVFGGQD